MKIYDNCLCILCSITFSLVLYVVKQQGRNKFIFIYEIYIYI